MFVVGYLLSCKRLVFFVKYLRIDFIIFVQQLYLYKIKKIYHRLVQFVLGINFLLSLGGIPFVIPLGAIKILINFCLL